MNLTFQCYISVIGQFERPCLIIATIRSAVKLQTQDTVTLLLLNEKIDLLLHKCHTTEKCS